ncbi:hypothetical protein [Tenacibaculum ovolyticum]|uniref:hypothetical protein n=1 Tax=Tenacibaculum ovolyticum TaxID=104270 RepID=UPI001F203B8D|nr:hypothetical protein [Tenacibaculum ovolyticum]
MWIEICEDIFENGDFKSLNFLYQILSWYPSGSFERYKIFIDFEKVNKLENYEKLKKHETDFDLLVESSFNEFITSSSSNQKKNYYITYKKSKINFEIEEAIQFFKQPVSIILENNKNDSAFLRAIIQHFGKANDINIAQEHLNNNWIRFENAGGCSNMPNFIEMFLKQFEILAIRNNRSVTDYFRGLVILDSDKEYTNQLSKHIKLINKITTLGIEEDNIHVLEKRMMENYMPDEVFKELRDLFLLNKFKNKELIDWINVYLNLRPNSTGVNEKKDFLNINKGKLKGEILPTTIELTNLYDLSDANFKILNNGFKYEKKQFKNMFPLLFINSTLVNKHTLSIRCGTSEYDTIMNKINRLL